MSVYKPKNSPYFQFDFIWQGRRFYGKTGCTTKRDALEYERRERQKAVLPRMERPPLTVDEACGLYAEHAEHLPSWATVRYMLSALVSGIGKDRLLSEVSQRDLQTYFARRRDGRSNSTVNREIENCRSVWRRAEKARYDVGEVPDWASLMLKVAKRPPRELSTAEETSLMPSLRVDLHDVVDFALKSGWRQSEVMGLRWADCDLGNRQATTRIKGGDIVKRPLTVSLVTIIANQPKVGPFVFTYVAQRTKPGFKDKKGRPQPARRKGERYPMTKTVLRGPWVAAKIDAGVENFRFHDLRHTRGTQIVRETGNLAAAKEALKHSNIKTTLRYAHVMDGDVRNALDASLSRKDNACRERDVTLSNKA